MNIYFKDGLVLVNSGGLVVVDTETVSPSTLFVNPFEFTITTVTPQNFTLPLTNRSPGHNLFVDWGDGSPQTTITAYNDPNKIHSYSSAGTYIVQLSGLCAGFEFAGTGDRALVKSVDSWGDVGFRRVNFWGCSTLSALPTETGKLTAVTSFFRLCLGCTSLIEIPSGIFQGNTVLTDANGSFYGCTSLTEIPSGLLDFNFDWQTFFTDCFNNCISLSGDAPDIWTGRLDAYGTRCFRNDTTLSNYASIPTAWK